MMRWVEHCVIYPARCAVFPQYGGRNPQVGPYLDTGVTNITGERIYLSRAAVEMAAGSLGMTRRGDETGLAAENEALRARVEALEAEAEQNAGVVSAANTLLEAVA
jgi:hypothetical protein